jgi:acyl carrier protein
MSELPRTASGKIDRAQLKTLASESPATADNRPSGALERAIAEEWGRVLKVEDVDVAANFFEQGGDSLKAMELVSVLQEKFRTEVPMLALFFEEPTIAALAVAIHETSVDPAAPESADRS